MTDLDLKHFWEPKPQGWGFLQAGVVCDLCGRWQVLNASGQTLEQQFRDSGWTRILEDRDGEVLQTDRCVVCVKYGGEVSLAISEVQYQLTVAQQKEAYWSRTVQHHMNVLKLLRRKGEPTT